MSVITFDPIPAPQPHRREPDLSHMTPSERAELKAFVARLQRSGGYSPGHIRRVLSPAEERRLIELERKVRWAPCDPTRGATRSAVASEHAKGVSVLMPKRVADGRRKNATSDLVDAVQRICLVLDCPLDKTIDPRRDPDCVARIEQCAGHLTRIAGMLESQPAMQIGA